MRIEAYSTPPGVGKPLPPNEFSPLAKNAFPSFTNPPESYRNTYCFKAEDNLLILACAAFSISMRYHADGPPADNEALRFARFLRPHSTAKGAAFVALRRAFKDGDNQNWRGQSLAKLDHAIGGALIQKSYFSLKLTDRFDLLNLRREG